jgi:hypothetical protein
MKQLLITAAAAGAVASPALATPADALTLGALFCTAALGTAIIGATVFREVERVKLRSDARPARGSYVRQ